MIHAGEPLEHESCVSHGHANEKGAAYESLTIA